MSDPEPGALRSAVVPREPTDHFGILLLLLVGSFTFTGLPADEWRVVAGVVNGAMLLVAARSTGVAAGAVRMGAAIAVSLLAAGFLAVVDQQDRIAGPVLLMQAAIVLVIAAAIGRRLLQHEHVTGATVAGALCLYVLLGLLFAWVYAALDAFYDDPVLQATSGRADPVYYSFVVLTTLGFGDVTSTVDFVRRLSILEALSGQILLVTLVARLVSMFGAESRGSRRMR
jgi:hypothetical protein